MSVMHSVMRSKGNYSITFIAWSIQHIFVDLQILLTFSTHPGPVSTSVVLFDADNLADAVNLLRAPHSTEPATPLALEQVTTIA